MRHLEFGHILAAPRSMTLPDGSSLRLLTASAVLEAAAQADLLAKDSEQRPLCANATLLARAWFVGDQPKFKSPEALLAACSVSEIARLAQILAEFEQNVNPSFLSPQEDIDALKKTSSTRPLIAFAGACSAPLAHFLRKIVRRICSRGTSFGVPFI